MSILSYSAGKPEELMLKVREENATDWTDLVISNYSTSRDNHVTTTVDLALFAAKKAQIAFEYIKIEKEELIIHGIFTM